MKWARTKMTVLSVLCIGMALSAGILTGCGGGGGSSGPPPVTLPQNNPFVGHWTGYAKNIQSTTQINRVDLTVTTGGSISGTFVDNNAVSQVLSGTIDVHGITTIGYVDQNSRRIDITGNVTLTYMNGANHLTSERLSIDAGSTHIENVSIDLLPG